MPQVVLQAVAPHRNSPQLAVAAVGQLPEPEQNEASVAVAPVHDGLLHITVAGCCWQAPLPSQAPLLPQVPLAGQRPCGSATVLGTLAQVPRLPVTLQAWQLPHPVVGLVLQQTPSMQAPLPHSWLPRQATPLVLTGRQLPFVPLQ
jgi:hypothetical protein